MNKQIHVQKMTLKRIWTECWTSSRLAEELALQFEDIKSREIISTAVPTSTGNVLLELHFVLRKSELNL